MALDGWRWGSRQRRLQHCLIVLVDHLAQPVGHAPSGLRAVSRSPSTGRGASSTSTAHPCRAHCPAERDARRDPLGRSCARRRRQRCHPGDELTVDGEGPDEPTGEEPDARSTIRRLAVGDHEVARTEGVRLHDDLRRPDPDARWRRAAREPLGAEGKGVGDGARHLPVRHQHGRTGHDRRVHGPARLPGPDGRCRGTFGSGGTFEPFAQEADDAADIVAWMRGRPWFDGRFATQGYSYLGFVQWALLMDPPPEMKAAVIACGPYDFSAFALGTGGFHLSTLLSGPSSSHTRRTRSCVALRRSAPPGSRSGRRWTACR